MIIRFCLVAFLVLFPVSAGHAQGQSPALSESIPSGVASPTPLQLGLQDAIDRAVQNNLATVSGAEAERLAAARRLQDLAELFPKVDAYLASAQQQVNLAAFGFSGFPGVSQIVGPFALVDARAMVSQPVVDLERLHNFRESSENERAAVLSNLNTRELVVLTAVDLYFRAVSGASRVTAIDAQVTRARALHQRAVNLKEAGVVPGIDVLRAEVELRSEEQRLIQARNAVEKQKLALARAIGLPLEQSFELVDGLPDEVQTDLSMGELLEQANANRADAKALEARIRAAGEALKATNARKLPTLNVQGNYGAIGRAPGSSHGTYSLRAEVRVPLFDRSIEGDALEREALLRQREADRDSLRGKIEYEVRTALLDLQSAAQQIDVANQSLILARQQLDQAQDRFSAGVAGNLEVVQAQEAVALGSEGVIQSLYGFNIARALLARATGTIEQAIQESFGSSLR